MMTANRAASDSFMEAAWLGRAAFARVAPCRKRSHSDLTTISPHEC